MRGSATAGLIIFLGLIVSILYSFEIKYPIYNKNNLNFIVYFIVFGFCFYIIFIITILFPSILISYFIKFMKSQITFSFDEYNKVKVWNSSFDLYFPLSTVILMGLIGIALDLYILIKYFYSLIYHMQSITSDNFEEISHRFYLIIPIFLAICLSVRIMISTSYITRSDLYFLYLAPVVLVLITSVPLDLKFANLSMMLASARQNNVEVTFRNPWDAMVQKILRKKGQVVFKCNVLAISKSGDDVLDCDNGGRTRDLLDIPASQVLIYHEKK